VSLSLSSFEIPFVSILFVLVDSLLFISGIWLLEFRFVSEGWGVKLVSVGLLLVLLWSFRSSSSSLSHLLSPVNLSMVGVILRVFSSQLSLFWLRFVSLLLSSFEILFISVIVIHFEYLIMRM